MNKKGDITITILVIGIVIVCGLAIISFLFSINNVKKDLVAISTTEKLNSDIGNYYFHKYSLGVDDSELQLLFDIKTDANGKYLEVVEQEISIKYYLLG